MVADPYTEQQLLLLALADPQRVFHQILSEKLDLRLFSSFERQAAFSALLRAFLHEGLLDRTGAILVLRDIWREGGLEDEALQTLIEPVEVTGDPIALVRRLQTLALARDAEQVTQRFLTNLTNSPTKARTLLASVSGELVGLTRKSSHEDPDPIEALQELFGAVKGNLSTGVASIDEALAGGIPFGVSTLWAAATGQGKSSWAKHLAASAIRQAVPVIFFTTEEPRHLGVRKIGSNLASWRERDRAGDLIWVSWEDFGDRIERLIKEGQPPEDDRDDLVLDSLSLMREHLRIYEQCRTVEEMAQKVELHRVEFPEPGLVLIDHIHRLALPKESKNNLNVQYRDAAYFLDDLAKRHGWAVAIMGQVSNEVSREWLTKRQVVELKFKESGDILQAGWKGVMFGRSDIPGQTIFDVMKDRLHGHLARTSVWYDPRTGFYSDDPQI